MRNFFTELKRRRVVRVIGLYLVAAWVAVQVADTVFPRLGLPDWSVTLVVGFALVGLPIAAVLAWAVDITPDGVRAEAPATGGTPRAAWAGLGILIGLVGFGGYAYLGTPVELPGEVDDNRIAVLPFEIRADASLSYLSEAFVDLLSAKFANAGALTSVDPAALLGHVGRVNAPSRLDPAEAARIARVFGAGHYVLGSVVQLGGELEIQARLYDSGADVVASANVTTSEEKLGPALDELSRRLLAEHMRGPAAEFARAAALATHSLPALKAFLLGETALRQGNIETAVGAFEQAVALDTTFGYAYFRLAVARSWMPRSSTAYARTIDAIEASLARADSLPDREATLVHLFAAYWQGQSDRAEQLAWKILGSQPENVEAQYYLGETLFHGAGARGRDMQESREPLERTVALQPDHAHALLHLVDLALARGDAATIDTVGARLAVIAPHLATQMAAYRAVILPAPDRMAALQAALSGEDGEAIADIAWRATALTRDPEIAQAFGEVLERATSHPNLRVAALRMRASAAAAEGRWDEATSLIDRQIEEPDGVVFAATVLVASRGNAPVDVLRRVYARLREDNLMLGTRPADVTPAELMVPYLVGQMALLLSDADAHDAAVNALEEIARSRPPAAAEVPATLARALQAHAAGADGRAQDAIQLLERTDAARWSTLEAVLMGDMLRSIGRGEEAARWYNSVPEFQSGVFADLPIVMHAKRAVSGT